MAATGSFAVLAAADGLPVLTAAVSNEDVLAAADTHAVSAAAALSTLALLF